MPWAKPAPLPTGQFITGVDVINPLGTLSAAMAERRGYGCGIGFEPSVHYFSYEFSADSAPSEVKPGVNCVISSVFCLQVNFGAFINQTEM